MCGATLLLPALITRCEMVEWAVQCACLGEREVIRCQFLDFPFPQPLHGLHLRKWILQIVYSAPRDKTNT